MDPVAYSKQPAEIETIEIDWTERIAAGDSLSSEESKMYDEDGKDETTAMINSTSITGNSVFVVVKAGEAGKKYHLRCRATTTNGEVYEEDLDVHVRQEGY